MSELKLTKKEQAWLERFQKTMAAAPKTLGNKIWSYTIGDNNITLYDIQRFNAYFEKNPTNHSDNRDHCQLVEVSGSEIMDVNFPFPVESTAG